MLMQGLPIYKLTMYLNNQRKEKKKRGLQCSSYNLKYLTKARLNVIKELKCTFRTARSYAGSKPIIFASLEKLLPLESTRYTCKREAPR